MSNPEPSLVIVSAPSGAGKSTALKRVLSEVPQIRFSVSHTTRPPRAGETDGVEYHFVDRPSFEALIRNRQLLEWAEVHGQLYGTARSEHEQAARDGVDLLLDLDVQGAANARRAFPNAVTIFILPPSFEDLERRLRGRGQDGEEAIRGRLETARQEMKAYSEYDYTIVNDDLDACVETLKALIRAARCRTGRMTGTARRILETFE